MEETDVTCSLDDKWIDGNCLSNSTNVADASTSFSSTSNDETDRKTPMRAKLTYDPTSANYDMSGDRLMFIFNHKTFMNSAYYTSTPKPREGTDHDVSRLQTSFERLKFIVEPPCDNYTHGQILKKLDNICRMDHSTTSCLAIAILTHGKSNGMVHAADRPYPVSDLINSILHNPNLAGKPKLFFIQACRGENVDSGHRIQIDGGRSSVTIPTHSDYLMLMSSFDEQVSFRGKSGSWMIQALCDVMDEHREKYELSAGKREEEDFLSLVTKVNSRVAAKFSCSKNPEYNEKKQIPETRFTLTKFLKFFNDN